MISRMILAAALCLAITCAMPPRSLAAEEPAFAAVKRLGRGINILGFDGIWDGGVDAPFRFRNFRKIRSAGFQHVRINFHAFKYMNAEGIVDPVVLGALDDVLAASIDAGLIPIIDEHNTDECESDIKHCGELLVGFWRQIATRYRAQYPSAMYEILNEPGGRNSLADWNALALRALETIRSIDRERFVIIAGLNSQDPQEMKPLQLPEDDRRIILTVHYYKPFDFTHQGAPWIPGKKAGIRWGSASDIADMQRDFQSIDRWAKVQRRPLYLGEFGVYEAAAMDDRARYLSTAARTAEQLQWAWAAWQFDHDFAVFDTDRDSWNAPLLRALIP